MYDFKRYTISFVKKNNFVLFANKAFVIHDVVVRRNKRELWSFFLTAQSHDLVLKLKQSFLFFSGFLFGEPSLRFEYKSIFLLSVIYSNYKA